MHQDTPEEYYSIFEVFNFLGKDIFTFEWTGEEIRIGQDGLLAQKLPKIEEYFIKELNVFSFRPFSRKFYRDYTEFDSKHRELWRKLTSKLSIKFFKELGGSFIRISLVSEEEFVFPNTPFKNSDDFIQSAMRYFVVRKRLLSMFNEKRIVGYLQDNDSGEICELPMESWSESKRDHPKGLLLDILKGEARYGFGMGSIFRNFHGPLIVPQESFNMFRRGVRAGYRKSPSTPEIIPAKEELGSKMEPDKKVLESSSAEESLVVEKESEAPRKGSAHMIKLAECYEYFSLEENPMPAYREIEKWIKEHAPFIDTERKTLYFIAFLREPGKKKKKQTKKKRTEVTTF